MIQVARYGREFVRKRVGCKTLCVICCCVCAIAGFVAGGMLGFSPHRGEARGTLGDISDVVTLYLEVPFGGSRIAFHIDDEDAIEHVTVSLQARTPYVGRNTFILIAVVYLFDHEGNQRRIYLYGEDWDICMIGNRWYRVDLGFLRDTVRLALDEGAGFLAGLKPNGERK